MFSTITLDHYKQVTGKSADEVLLKFLLFMDGDSDKMISYYNGQLEVVDFVAFHNFNVLVKSVDETIELFVDNKELFNSYDFWRLFEMFESIQLTLGYLDNISKYLRSSIIKGHFSRSVETGYTLKQNQTLIQVADKIQNSNDPINDWVDLAIKNQVREEDYDNDGGFLLHVRFDKSGMGIENIDSVVDNINGININGKDIQQHFQFDSVGQDIVVLDYEKTMSQTVDILSKLRKGNNPQYFDDGFSKDLVGTDKSSLAFPVIFRQIFNTFSTDDTIASIGVTDIKIIGDAIYVKATIETKYGQIIQQEIIL